MRTATALLKTKLVITGLKEITIPVQYTMLEYLGYGRTDRYVTKVINSLHWLTFLEAMTDVLGVHFLLGHSVGFQMDFEAQLE